MKDNITLKQKINLFFQRHEKKITTEKEVCDFIDNAPTKSGFSREKSIPVLSFLYFDNTIVFYETKLSYEIKFNSIFYYIDDKKVSFEKIISFINNNVLYFENQLLSLFIDFKRIIHLNTNFLVNEWKTNNNTYPLLISEMERFINAFPKFKKVFNIHHF